MAVTLADLARATDLSQAAVSRILNGQGRFKDETRDRVAAAAERLGYRTRAAQATRLRTLALLLPENPGYGPLFHGLLEGLQDGIDPRRQHLRFMRIPTDGSTPPITDCDGLIINQHFHCPPAFLAALAAAKIPTVWINHIGMGSAVSIDDIWYGEAATRELLARGHRKISFFNALHGPTDVVWHRSSSDRRHGYEETMRGANLPVDVLWRDGGFDDPAGLDRVVALLGRADAPTALVCYDQPSAQLAAMAMHIVNRPGTAIVACNDRTVTTPMGKLDTWIIDGRQLGREAIRLLHSDATEPITYLLRPLLVTGEWCRAPGGS